MAAPSPPQRTSLYEAHLAAGARMVEFAGWEMPVEYSGVIEEHRAVRRAAGLFDVSHMGEIRVAGPEAEAFLQWLTPNDVARLTPGRAHYTALLDDEGGYLDDLLVYRLGEQQFLLVVNAANTPRDLAWVVARGGGRDVEVEDRSAAYALLALQGPRAEAILQPLASVDLDGLGAFHFYEAAVAGHGVLVSRTGYTGEDGFEIYVAPGDAKEIWDRLLEAGEEHGIRPAGLGARDTLRLEAGLPLYGHELYATVTPFEAGLGWIVKLEKGDFVGRDALLARRAVGIRRRLMGFEVAGRGIARQGHGLAVDGELVGEVTSGTWSPTFEKALGMAYVPAGLGPGREVTLRVREREIPAVLAALPFYRRGG